MAEPSVAAIICTRDRPAMLAGCLEAVRGAMRPGDEVVVVDSASRAGTTAEVADRFGFPVVRLERPGLSRARNAGVEATTAPLVAFTDDDCQPDRAWMARVSAGFTGASVGFLTGRVNADQHERAVSVFESATPRWWGPEDDVLTMGHGANMAFRREVLEELGGFDERLGAGSRFPAAEDTDLFWRALRTGWSGRYEPGAIVTHLQWRSRNDVLRVEYRYGVGGGAFAAKVRAVERREGRALIGRLLWDEAAAPGLRHLRAGHRLATATCALRLAGTVSGLVRGRALASPDDWPE